MDNSVLKMESIVKSYPGVKALDGVDLEVHRGEVHAICGENGAGKSTLMKIISGAQSYTSGHMWVGGKEHVFHSTRDAEKAGIAMIYQEFNMVPELTVAENMFLGRLPSKGGHVSFKKLYALAQSELDKMGLHIDPKARVCNLTVAEAQMVEIAKCLTIGAEIIIMDEPTAALTDEEVRVLFKIIADLKTRNISILYISHRMDEIFQISDRLTVLRDGKRIATKSIEETNYDEVVSMMVGRTIDNLYPERVPPATDVVFEAKNIVGHNVDDISFQLNRGEILGIAGLIGSGAIELSKLLYGAIPMKSGEVWLNGRRLRIRRPSDAIKNGIGFVSDDRKNEGLVLIRDVKENTTLSSMKKVKRGFHIVKKLEHAVVQKEIELLNIKVSSMSHITGKLSGGNQQKVVFAKVLETDCDILILDEPTRGIDVGAKLEIYEIMQRLTLQGKSVILISTDLPEMAGMSDRILVVREGKIVKELMKEQITQETILAYESGGVNDAEAV